MSVVLCNNSQCVPLTAAVPVLNLAPVPAVPSTQGVYNWTVPVTEYTLDVRSDVGNFAWEYGTVFCVVGVQANGGADATSSQCSPPIVVPGEIIYFIRCHNTLLSFYTDGHMIFWSNEEVSKSRSSRRPPRW